MSDVTKKAMFSKLTGDATLVALLGAQADGLPPIFNASLNKLNSPAFPLITFREADGSADPRAREETLDSEIFEIEIWAKTESALVVPVIHNRLDTLLHNGTLTLASGTLYDCYRLTQSPDQYDAGLNLHFGLYRYRLILSRS